MTTVSTSPATRHKKTFMIDGLTRSRLETLSMLLDTHQTDVFRRAVSLMHALHAESEGCEIYLVDMSGRRAKLDVDENDGFEDERKMTLMFNDETLGKVSDLAEAFDIFATYVFRRAVALFSAVYCESLSGRKIMMVNTSSGESETLRFF